MQPSIWWVLWPVLILSLLGALAGHLITGTSSGMGWGLVFGTLSGMIWAVRGVARLMFPESFYSYESDAESVPDNSASASTIISLTIPEQGAKQLRGLSMDEWHTLARGVVERRYRYTMRDLQDIFGSQIGSGIYGRATQQLIDAGVLVPAGSNGVAVTDHVGRHFFNQLDKRDYKILDLIPSSARESI